MRYVLVGLVLTETPTRLLTKAQHIVMSKGVGKEGAEQHFAADL